MKGKFRFTKMIVSVMIILSLFFSNVHAYDGVGQNFGFDGASTLRGKVIPLNVVTSAFADEIDYDDFEDIQFKNAMSFSGDDVSVNLMLYIDPVEVQLEYAGKMYKSFRYKDDKPVYVGVFENNNATNDYEIIYFEISNDKSPYNLDQNLRNSSSVTIYLRSADGTIYALGSKLKSPIVLDGVEDQAPSENDMTWFLNVINGVYNETNSSSARSTYSSMWGGDLHTLEYQIGDYQHRFTATPYIDFSYGDVPYSGVMPFSMSLKISEAHRYRLAGDTDWSAGPEGNSKCFAIDNVQLTWTAGGNTQISYVAPHLNTHDQGGDNFPFTAVAAAVTGVLPQTATLSTILTVADSILSTGQAKSFTNTNMGGSLSNTSAYKIKFPSNYYIEESGYGLDNTVAERFEHVAFMATKDSSLTRAYRTYAVADFTFTLSWADITGQSGSRVYTSYKQLSYYNNY